MLQAEAEGFSLKCCKLAVKNQQNSKEHYNAWFPSLQSLKKSTNIQPKTLYEGSKIWISQQSQMKKASMFCLEWLLRTE